MNIAVLKSVRTDCKSQVPLHKGRQRGLGVSPSRTTAVDLGGSSVPHPFEKRYTAITNNSIMGELLFCPHLAISRSIQGNAFDPIEHWNGTRFQGLPLPPSVGVPLLGRQREVRPLPQLPPRLPAYIHRNLNNIPL